MPKKILFLDRDGCLILEPKTDFQVDSLEKLEFLPLVISTLQKITQEFDYYLVMVTNQDGLGTTSFPENTFWPAHNKMLKTFENEGIIFDEIFIDKTFEKDNKPTRKPGTAMLTKFINNPEFDLTNSIVIGDRESDMMLAKNLNSKSILIGEINSNLADFQAKNWQEIYQILKNLEGRKAEITRETKETKIKIKIDLDSSKNSEIQTSIGFLDHMLESFAKHSGIYLKIKAEGDTHIDNHHLVEDIGITLGMAIQKALGDKKGINRFGFAQIPLDEAISTATLDLSGRFYLGYSDNLENGTKVGELETEMVRHFFYSIAENMKATLHLKITGENQHHQIESAFKSFAHSFKQAISKNSSNQILSTKGVI